MKNGNTVIKVSIQIIKKKMGIGNSKQSGFLLCGSKADSQVIADEPYGATGENEQNDLPAVNTQEDHQKDLSMFRNYANSKFLVPYFLSNVTLLRTTVVILQPLECLAFNIS